MRRILDIGHNDLRVFLKKKSAYVWLFVVPLLFIYFFGNANKDPGDPKNRRPKVFVKNDDKQFLSEIFLKILDKQEMRLRDKDRDEAAAEIHIPSDFTSNILHQQQTKVRLLKGKDSNGESDEAIIELGLARGLIAMNSYLVEVAMSTNGLQSATEDQLRALVKQTNSVALDAHFAGRQPVPSGFNFSLPSNLVTYLLMNLMLFGGAAMARERRNGVIKRLVVHPITHGELVMGKIYGLMLLGTVQILFFLALGKFAFGVNLGANFLSVTLVLLIFAWVAGSLGVFAGSVLAAEDRVTGICVLISLVIAALGGCWWPLELAPPGAKIAALCVPTGWAMKALNQLISFGNGFGAVLLPIAVLLAFGAAANLLAARFFRAE